MGPIGVELGGRQIAVEVARNQLNPGVAKLADVQDLGSCAERRVGSSPSTRTNGRQGDLPKALV